MMLSLMSQEEMTKTLEELLPTDASLLRDENGAPKLDRGILAMLLILAVRLEERASRLDKLGSEEVWLSPADICQINQEKDAPRGGKLCG